MNMGIFYLIETRTKLSFVKFLHVIELFGMFVIYIYNSFDADNTIISVLNKGWANQLYTKYGIC